MKARNLALALALAVGGAVLMLNGVFSLSPTNGVATRTTEPSTAAGSGPTKVAVTGCKTTFGVRPRDSGVPLQHPPSLKVSLDTAVAAQLQGYSDRMGRDVLLGPKGWGCWARIYADGNSDVGVNPSGVAPPFPSNQLTVPPGVGVELSEHPPGTMPGTTALCNVFPIARRAAIRAARSIGLSPSSYCINPVPSGMVLRFMSATEATFRMPQPEEPDAYGVFIYPRGTSRDPSAGSSFQASCVLPETDLCFAILGDVASRYGSSGSRPLVFP